MRVWLLWLAALAAATGVMTLWRGELHEAHVVLTYLLVVMGGSAHRGRRLGVFLAVSGFLLFDVIFLPPYGTLQIQRPADWFILVAYLVVSLVAAQLFERARLQADAARQLTIRDTVVASMSHDLRTPLTTIKAMAHDLAELGDERAILIEEEADRLSTLVADMLDLSRIGSGVAVCRPELNEAEDLLGAALQRISGHARGRDIRVTLDPAEAILFGRFDFAQTLRVLVNLIENALKYSPPESPVDVGVRREGPWLVFKVSDRGGGISEQERSKIFEPFYRQSDTASSTPGTGLGLAISHAIVKEQHGAVDYARREGGGSVFTVRLPAIDVADVAAS